MSSWALAINSVKAVGTVAPVAGLEIALGVDAAIEEF